MDVRLRALAAASPSVLAIAAASVFVFAPPAEAATASCAPTANGQVGSSSRTNASGVQICQGGDTGIAYQATGGALTVNLNNDPITGHAININDDGNARI